ncbi:glycosyltransferase family 4 protein [Natranaerobius thermophilus]|uniref:Glycosyl transferase group 1 n=1 Tax=Natranaerobius thermophilus (strain ATCC BAA-1301 / DSM 18059 / JW/NM-WN-LF) TaxID=457570 RepID=B2A1P1_NATTJ|nr:glycosyltransferase family 4 protein [Natranaerobius thermophilus]ACB86088.1 glycosyl transferase group 1 [Natranaerobius thermophilus JW/NM-WN-LF]
MTSSNNKHILILNHHASSPNVGGGARHYELGEFLSSKKYYVSIVSSSYSKSKNRYHYDEEIKIETYNQYFNFIYLKTKPPFGSTLNRFRNYLDYMNKAYKYREYYKNPDVVIASSVHPLAWSAGYKISRKYNAKFVVEVRDLWPLSMYEDFSGITRKGVFSFFEYFERKYYNLADKIITTAPYAYEYIEEKYAINRDKVVNIPHGIDIKNFDRNLQKSEHNLPQDLKKILDNYFCITYTGSLSQSEGLETLVEAAKHLQKYEEIKIVIVGGGSEKEKLKNEIQQNKLNNVTMFDKVDRDLVPLILKKSKVLFCGLKDRKVFKYGISKNKFYDYMAASKPIIFASNVRGSIISKAEAGITIPPGDPKNLADNIVNLYKNINTLGVKYGENGRHYVEKNHTVNTISGQFLEVIEES